MKWMLSVIRPSFAVLFFQLGLHAHVDAFSNGKQLLATTHQITLLLRGSLHRGRDCGDNPKCKYRYHARHSR